jgi:hypothetical protein
LPASTHSAHAPPNPSPPATLPAASGVEARGLICRADRRDVSLLLRRLAEGACRAGRGQSSCAATAGWTQLKFVVRA